MNSDPRSEHRRAWEAIPWVVNGSASDADRRWVEAHVSGCTDCRDELQFQSRLRHGMTVGAPAPRAPDVPLERLWARIDAADTARDEAPAPRAARGGVWGRSRLLAAAVVVQSVALAALAGLALSRGGDAAYQTLSQPAAPPASASVRLVVSQQLTLAQLQGLLERSGFAVAQVGEDASILTLAPRSAGRAPAPDAITRLRAEPGVLLAEPIAPAGAGLR